MGNTPGGRWCAPTSSLVGGCDWEGVANEPPLPWGLWGLIVEAPLEAAVATVPGGDGGSGQPQLTPDSSGIFWENNSLGALLALELKYELLLSDVWALSSQNRRNILLVIVDAIEENKNSITMMLSKWICHVIDISIGLETEKG
ncbi:hypothetical protein Scep_012187 [Stephania cephalantha]|uniref:Uncharacterized protein n=1 Tax=Stephania cephalantha TaxID=152367 RepID=A0AAP0JEM8_9MAGN